MLSGLDNVGMTWNGIDSGISSQLFRRDFVAHEFDRMDVGADERDSSF